MAQSVATPMGCPSLAEAWPSRPRAFQRNQWSGIPAQRLENINIEKPVANWRHPGFIVFGSFFGRVYLPWRFPDNV
jgi:hypothetical protein